MTIIKALFGGVNSKIIIEIDDDKKRSGTLLWHMAWVVRNGVRADLAKLFSIAKLLIEAGADVDADGMEGDVNCTPLWLGAWAVRDGMEGGVTLRGCSSRRMRKTPVELWWVHLYPGG